VQPAAVAQDGAIPLAGGIRWLHSYKGCLLLVAVLSLEDMQLGLVPLASACCLLPAFTMNLSTAAHLATHHLVLRSCPVAVAAVPKPLECDQAEHPC